MPEIRFFRGKREGVYSEGDRDRDRNRTRRPRNSLLPIPNPKYKYKMRETAISTAAANVNTESHRHVQSRERWRRAPRQLPNIYRVNHQISNEVGLTNILGIPSWLQ